jgi:hypothetical protein
MNIVKRIDQYNNSCVFFNDSIKNNIINEGMFIRIIYSTQNVVLNGIYLLITINNIISEKYYSKYRCNFNIIQNIDVIENIKTIEEDLLAKIEIKNKIPQYKIYDQLKNGNLKIFTDIGNKSVCSFILKISGIWETSYNYGLTYKFIKITQ